MGGFEAAPDLTRGEDDNAAFWILARPMSRADVGRVRAL